MPNLKNIGKCDNIIDRNFTDVISTSTCIKPGANVIEDQKRTKLTVLGIGLDIEQTVISTFVGAAGRQTKLTIGTTTCRNVRPLKFISLCYLY